MNVRFLHQSIKGIGFYLSLVIGLFVFVGVFAFYVPSLFTFFDPYLRELLVSTEDLSGFALFWFIVSNNISVSFFAFFGGLFFGLLPVLFALSNGAIVGYVLYLVSEERSGSWWYLIPHGVFELPAVFLSLALGLRLGVHTVHFLLSLYGCARIRTEGLLLVRRLREGFLFLCCVIIPLLVIAGVIETWLIVTS